MKCHRYRSASLRSICIAALLAACVAAQAQLREEGRQEQTTPSPAGPVSAAPASTAPAPVNAAQSAPDAQIQAAQAPATPGMAALTEKGLALLKANQPQPALEAFQQALTINPDDVAANLLAAGAALALYKGDLAVQYAEKARQLDPDNWKVHTTLVAAYAAAGKKAQRDQEREILRKLHDDPHAPDAMQTSGFLLEIFPVKQYRVEAIEYFHPVGKLHLYYRFQIRNAQGRRVWQIDAESNDFDQSSWAKAHPEEAAAGKRQFQLTGEDADVRTDYRMYTGSPDYDSIRAQIVEVIEAQKTPFPGEKGQ